MADIELLKDYYLERDYRDLKDKCFESPLPIARIVICGFSFTDNFPFTFKARK